MSEKPTSDPAQTVNQVLLGQFFIWLGLILGLTIISIVLVGIRLLAPVPPPFPDSPEIGYGFLLIVPLGLLGAYFAGSIIPAGNPAETARRSSDPSGSTAWDEITEKDLADWCPAFQGGLMIRLSLLEGPGIVCAIGFFMTGEWVVLAGTGVMLAALIAQRPTRARLESWVRKARERGGSGPGDG